MLYTSQSPPLHRLQRDNDVALILSAAEWRYVRIRTHVHLCFTTKTRSNCAFLWRGFCRFLTRLLSSSNKCSIQLRSGEHEGRWSCPSSSNEKNNYTVQNLINVPSCCKIALNDNQIGLEETVSIKLWFDNSICWYVFKCI